LRGDVIDRDGRRHRPGGLGENIETAGELLTGAIFMDIKNLNEVPSFKTKDGSEIRELLAHRNSAIRNQSLAEARLPVGGATQEHFHPRAEEIYYITHGIGSIRIEGATREVRAGDAIAIPPGQKHKLWNTGAETLRLLCCCAPAYEHSDTVLTEGIGPFESGAMLA
jgi:mannose-6-phosphate isomerase-like protein (cupin superfamily)